ncbi:thiamine-phosphate kinase [Coraliomargarita sp. SDUM461004]|uniref:Thiamine-monophosphate kinase n=1 Tax=Thalassobacterium sedimentorum TaxID=3041258 RepID=A0ABU1AFA2_9BACT|nr:thiamine-phosphate kinase [Coraliomargarita sp. SDUM461004]MDQ8193364.1 thiamine-phosphate kinase [Coraliomargarita sp. SDUM461004]
MFSDNSHQTIHALGEVELITAIGKWLGPVSPPSPTGMGDDCAVMDTSNIGRQLFTTDSVSYGRHFDNSVPPSAAGAKLIKRNLSDIAAMGGHPGPALLNLLCAPNLRTDWLQDFMSGIRQTCQNYQVSIVGGDIGTLPAGQFTAALSLTGQMHVAPLLRSGAEIGDAIYVTGTLGGSIYQKHYNFTPRLTEGQWLARSNYCSSMMDITDGIAKDLNALLPQGSAAHIYLPSLPLSLDAHRHAQKTGETALKHAFCDGEDYELLITIKSEAQLSKLESEWNARFPLTPLTKIGVIATRQNDALYLDASTKEALPWVKGFEHLV